MINYILFLSTFTVIIIYFKLKNFKYGPYSLCDSFTGLTKYKDIDGVCKIDCKIQTNVIFTNISKGSCKMRYNISRYEHNVINALQNLKITEYMYINGQFMKRYKKLNVFF